MPRSLFKIVKETLKGPLVADNSIIAFHDNSSAIAGFPCAPLRPSDALGPAPLAPTADTYHLILTAETHNFPTGVAPFAGAETGTGGRIGDVQATGRGAFVLSRSLSAPPVFKITLCGLTKFCFEKARERFPF